MMLGRSPPSVMWPWMMSPGMHCWRSIDRLEYAVTSPSSALMPSQGFAAACASRPKYSAWKLESAVVCIRAASAMMPGCEMRLTSTPCEE